MLRRVLKSGKVFNLSEDELATNIDEVSPDELIVFGYVQGPIGVKGDLKVVYERSFCSTYKSRLKKSVFSDLSLVWINSSTSIRCSRIVSAFQSKDFFRLNLEKIKSRELAKSFTGAHLEVSKEHLLSKLDTREQTNLLNFKIKNLNGKNLGIVEKVDGNGFHDWIFSGQIVIPLVDKYIKSIDTINRQLVVDWEDFW